MTIDGDDIGRRISSCYLSDDEDALRRVNNLVQEKVAAIARLMQSDGFSIIFCAADGVAGRNQISDDRGRKLYGEICDLVAPELTFSAGTGRTLREAFIALLYAKSSGKARICDFGDLK